MNWGLVWDFIFKFVRVFVSGFVHIFITTGSNQTGGLFGGFVSMFNFYDYKTVFDEFSSKNPGAGEWIVAIIAIVLVVALLLSIVVLLIRGIVLLTRRLFAKETNQDLIDEIAHLRSELKKSNRERDRIFKMRMNGKNTRLGINGDIEDYEEEYSPRGVQAPANYSVGSAPAANQNSIADTGNSRFYKLIEVDEYFNSPEYVPPVYDNEVTLEQICDRFRNWACTERHLYYEKRVIRLFFSAFATTHIVILQGISGTGKTSLPYAIGQWLSNPATIASVQPSWRDRTEIFGYFNEFTKRFNETEILKKMYEARYNEQLYLTVIDEANIARMEYYFAELLSILEMPSHDNWVVDVTPSGWASDPKFIEKGRFRLPDNMWYICTINNDDSTFAISDKVYDRAIPINIDSKGIPFEVSEEDRNDSHQIISYLHLEEMFKEAQEKYVVSEENIKKFDDMDNYVIEHFRLAFGNRIVKQLKEFVPVYVACGGTEIDGLDYVLCNKILRKFESLNLAYIRDEIDGYIAYLNEHFGEENMQESKAYLNRLKKLY